MALDAFDSVTATFYLFVMAAGLSYCMRVLNCCRPDHLAVRRTRRERMRAALESDHVPVSIYTRPSPAPSENSRPTCVVCLADFDDGDGLRTLACGHSFHAHCVDPWLIENQSCPLCKQDTLERVHGTLSHV